MADLGDISKFLKDGAVSDLSWLDVDEKTYREQDTLPKQNLDIAPDLEAIWAHDDKPATTYFDKDRPHTMGDMSEIHGDLRAKPEEIIRTARLAIMQSIDPTRFKHALTTRFDPGSIQAARTSLATVLAERGLLGRFYIDASDFYGCHNSQKSQTDFVRKYAADARYVKAKEACGNCVHAMRKSPTGGMNCAVFHKELVVDVPYTDALADQVEQLQQSKGKAVQASTAAPKERIRLALLSSTANYASAPTPKPIVNPAQYMKPTIAPEQLAVKPDLTKIAAMAREAMGKALREGRITVAQAQDGYRHIAEAKEPSDLAWTAVTATGLEAPARPVYVGSGQTAIPAPVAVSAEKVEAQLISASNLTKKRDTDMQQSVLARKAAPVLAQLRREMLKGRSAAELVHGLKLAFQSTDLAETRELWEPVFREAGLYGVVYSTQNSFDDCHTGHDFLAKHSSSVRAIVAGEKCTGCIYNKIGRCLLYGKPLVANVSEVVTWEVVDQVLQEQKIAGRIESWNAKQASTWGTTPADALKAIHQAAAAKGTPAVASPFRPDMHTAFRGGSPTQVTSGMTRRVIAKTASKYMNEGLYGNDLLAVLKSSFDTRDLVAAGDDLRPVLAEQGLQGIYYVDPTAYDDYGKGCDEPARLFRAKGVPYVKIGEKCMSCVYQTKVGHCSKINKPLVTEPPYADKLAQQRAVLASGNSTETSYASLQHSGPTMLDEYQMQNGGMNVEVDAVPEKVAVQVAFGALHKVKL